MPMMKAGDDVFESGCELMDVTSLSRPDPRWVHVDTHGHEHRWVNRAGVPATSYSPSESYDVPTLVRISDGVESFDDGDGYIDEIHVWHDECRLCGDRVDRGTTADTTTQYIPGMRWCRINGQGVTKQEFEARLKAITEKER